jgi:hypothetical protein
MELRGFLQDFVADFGIGDVVILALSALVMLIAHNQAGRLLRRVPGVPEKLDRNRIAPALPFLLLSAGHGFLHGCMALLARFFILSIIVSWYVLVFALEDLVALVYAMNGQARLFAIGDMPAKLQDFQSAFMPVAALQLLFAILLAVVWIARRRASQSDGRNDALLRRLSGWRFTLAFWLIGATAILAAYLLVWPRMEVVIDGVLPASAVAGNLASVASQFLLSPLYAQAIISLAGLIYGVLVIMILIYTGAKNALGSEDDTVIAASIKRIAGLRKVLIGSCAGASVSFAITLGALLAGDAFADRSIEAALRPTPRLLLWNAAFDGLTLFVTVQLLNRALAQILRGDFLQNFLVWVTAGKEDRSSAGQSLTVSRGTGMILLLVIVFVIDLVFAALFAMGSLMIGLSGTIWNVDLREASRILFGLAPGGDQLSFSGHFWVMHTTFVPTVVYAVFVLYAAAYMLAWLVAFAVSKLAFGWKRSETGVATTVLQTVFFWVMPYGVSQALEVALQPVLDRVLDSGSYVALMASLTAHLPRWSF